MKPVKGGSSSVSSPPSPRCSREGRLGISGLLVEADGRIIQNFENLVDIVSEDTSEIWIRLVVETSADWIPGLVRLILKVPDLGQCTARP